MTGPDRYDGVADWYDEHVAEFADAAGHELLDLFGPGPGRCLDLGCGTGINLRRLLNNSLRSDLRVVQVTEADDEDYPTRIGVLAER